MTNREKKKLVAAKINELAERLRARKRVLGESKQPRKNEFEGIHLHVNGVGPGCIENQIRKLKAAVTALCCIQAHHRKKIHIQGWTAEHQGALVETMMGVNRDAAFSWGLRNPEIMLCHTTPMMVWHRLHEVWPTMLADLGLAIQTPVAANRVPAVMVAKPMIPPPSFLARAKKAIFG